LPKLSTDKEIELPRRPFDLGRLCLPLAPLLALWALLIGLLPPGLRLPLPGGTPTLPSLPTLPTVPTIPTVPGGGTLPGGGFGMPGPDATGPLKGRYFTGEFTNAAGTRPYTGYVPSGYKPGTEVPLIVAMHGCSQSADTLSDQTKLDNLAEAKTFIVVYPQQTSGANPMKCWNWFKPEHQQRGQGEPSIIAGVTQWVQQNYTVDAKRIYMQGFSAGGAMGNVMAATYPDLYAANGVGSGIEYNGGVAAMGGYILDAKKSGQAAYQAMGTNARVVPTVIFHGAKDKIVPPSNADYLVQQWQTTNDLADDGLLNGSIPSAAVSTRTGISMGGQYTVSSYGDGRGKEIVQDWRILDMEHAWSGGCACTSYSYPHGPDATTAMYDFFMSHPKP
jgi:poly(hydroxyalkanoate) depolymerase family esterase